MSFFGVFAFKTGVVGIECGSVGPAVINFSSGIGVYKICRGTGGGRVCFHFVGCFGSSVGTVESRIFGREIFLAVFVRVIEVFTKSVHVPCGLDGICLTPVGGISVV